MDKKVALVTGASRGIGKAIAIALAKAEYYVVINYRSNEALAIEVLDEIKALGQEGELLLGDVSDFTWTTTALPELMKRLGRLDLLVNNAGITKDQLMLKMSESDFDQVMNVNLKGAFNCVQALTRGLMKQRYGKIINISSVIGLMGNIGQANYAASKAGLIGFSKSIAREFASRNIQVNVIAPGFIETEMTDQLSEEVKNHYLKNIPAARLGQAEEIAEAVVFLASEKANYITGQVLAIDGGLTM